MVEKNQDTLDEDSVKEFFDGEEFHRGTHISDVEFEDDETVRVKVAEEHDRTPSIYNDNLVGTLQQEGFKLKSVLSSSGVQKVSFLADIEDLDKRFFEEPKTLEGATREWVEDWRDSYTVEPRISPKPSMEIIFEGDIKYTPMQAEEVEPSPFMFTIITDYKVILRAERDEARSFLEEEGYL